MLVTERSITSPQVPCRSEHFLCCTLASSFPGRRSLWVLLNPQVCTTSLTSSPEVNPWLPRATLSESERCVNYMMPDQGCKVDEDVQTTFVILLPSLWLLHVDMPVMAALVLLTLKLSTTHKLYVESCSFYFPAEPTTYGEFQQVLLPLLTGPLFSSGAVLQQSFCLFDLCLSKTKGRALHCVHSNYP